MFIIPVILFSVLYNISKFWELDIYEERSLTFSNGTTVPEWRLTNETIAANEPLNVTVYLEPTELRKNSLYIRIYILWMNLIFNILGPFIVLATLNHIVSIVGDIQNCYNAYCNSPYENVGYFDKRERIEIKVNQNSSFDSNFAKSQVFLYCSYCTMI